MSYSQDLRERVLAAVDRGLARVEVALLFHVSEPTVKRWLGLRRQSGRISPLSPPGRSATILPEQRADLQAQITTFPDATLAEHTAHWNANHANQLTRWTMGRALKQLKWSRKKRA